ncbi:hypothetical protein CSV77_02975 [Sporosarcina sp. P16b]|uniref:hypothetical protein n=1 Tax=Sporosarcina sp. P16b TaxID=2048261 RepID=UPI000C163B50|nr:hypothetical protein [Sporosarcina sp. P16b]PIC72187.1 hypothetical protein CSV77_02975 [Sporosarcina sp. P16b]
MIVVQQLSQILKKGDVQLFKRTLYRSTCNREILDGEEIYAKMKAPRNIMMGEIKAYLKKKVLFYVRIVWIRIAQMNILYKYPIFGGRTS